MTTSVLLRLVSESLAKGEIIGQAISIATGDEVVVRDLDELLDFLRKCGKEEGGLTWTSTPPPTD